ncbi:MAG TPA: DUF5994 family protein [Pseudonocardia sp.]
MSAETTTSVLEGTAVLEGQRLSLKPDAEATGFVDGAWWPRSRDLAAELPAVTAEVAKRLGPVERVAYNISAWADSPRKIRIGDATVRMAGFHSLDFDTVQLIGARRRLVLLVVPPDTDEQTALSVLATAGDGDNTDSVDTLLHRGEPARSS